MTGCGFPKSSGDLWVSCIYGIRNLRHAGDPRQTERAFLVYLNNNNLRTHHKVIIGDSRNMEEIADESVHLIVTSPPYWQLKDYGNEKQIGFYDSYQEYINNLNLAWSECARVLHKGCRLCINIGDQFARSVYYGRYKVIPIRTEIIRFCEASGLDYMGAVIWRKVTTCNTSGGAVVMGSYPYPRNGILKIDYEFILIFKKPGKAPKVSKEIKEQSIMSKEEWNQYFSGHWNFPGIRQNGHIAMFPVELPRRLIKMFTFQGETVLDPFLGSGTTSLAAKELGRNSTGYEINEEFLPIIREKIGLEIETVKQEVKDVDFKEKMKDLPYIFEDPVKFSRKKISTESTFGSVINGKEKEEVEYFSVKQVITPETLVLNDGRKIRLLGISPDSAKTGEAVRFLEEKTSGQRVFLKFDQFKNDDDNNLYCYLYLKNKTFINAHLIKKGLAKVDMNLEFKYRERFLKYYDKSEK